MSALYRKKPIPVEARQLLGSEDGQTGRDLADWCGGSVGGLFAEPKVLVPTLEGDLTARVGDWIVKGPGGEFWPVKGSIFADTYEDADTPLHAGCRGGVLNEAADAIVSKQDEYEAQERKQFTHLDHETVLQGEAVRDMAALLRQMADEGNGTAHAARAATEYGISLPADADGPACVLDPTDDKTDAERRLDRYRDRHPNAALVQRAVTYGGWTDVTEAGDR